MGECENFVGGELVPKELEKVSILSALGESDKAKAIEWISSKLNEIAVRPVVGNLIDVSIDLICGMFSGKGGGGALGRIKQGIADANSEMNGAAAGAYDEGVGNMKDFAREKFDESAVGGVYNAAESAVGGAYNAATGVKVAINDAADAVEDLKNDAKAKLDEAADLYKEAGYDVEAPPLKNGPD